MKTTIAKIAFFVIVGGLIIWGAYASSKQRSKIETAESADSTIGFINHTIFFSVK